MYTYNVYTYKFIHIMYIYIYIYIYIYLYSVCACVSLFILVCVNYLDLGMYWLYVCLVYNRTNLFQDKYFLGKFYFKSNANNVSYK